LNTPAINRVLLKAEMARRQLYEFVIQAWPVLEPDVAFVDGAHMRAICEHLQAVTEGRIGNLIINVPPGHAKSLLAAVFWPAWVWINHPESRWLFSTYREPLAIRDSVKCRRLIESPWYRERWGDRFELASDQNQKNRFENTATGYRVVVPMSSGTGERGDYVVVDDPHSVDQAESDAERQSAIEWWNGSMATRLNDFRKGTKSSFSSGCTKPTSPVTCLGGVVMSCSAYQRNLSRFAGARLRSAGAIPAPTWASCCGRTRSRKQIWKASKQRLALTAMPVNINNGLRPPTVACSNRSGGDTGSPAALTLARSASRCRTVQSSSACR
jgi:hypothetical protein